MPLQYPALHASTHLPGGSDPLPVSGAVWELLTINSELVITSEGQGNFAWGHGAGSVLTDLTDPNNPLLLADGVYALTIPIFGDYGGTTTLFGYTLILGQGPVVTDDSVTVFPAPGAGSGFQSSRTLSYAGFLPAGQNLALYVTNFDASNQLSDVYPYDVVPGMSVVKLG